MKTTTKSNLVKTLHIVAAFIISKGPSVHETAKINNAKQASSISADGGSYENEERVRHTTERDLGYRYSGTFFRC